MPRKKKYSVRGSEVPEYQLSTEFNEWLKAFKAVQEVGETVFGMAEAGRGQLTPGDFNALQGLGKEVLLRQQLLRMTQPREPERKPFGMDFKPERMRVNY